MIGADGIHSALERPNAKGMFFYFTAPRDGGRAHFWRYYDLTTRKIIDNRYQIMQLIACRPDTPRFPPPYHEVDVFDIQEKVIANILGAVEQQEAAALVNKPVAEEQNIVAQILQTQLNNPAFNRAELRDLRKFLKQPLVGAAIQQLRKAVAAYGATSDPQELVDVVRALAQQQGEIAPASNGTPAAPERIKREQLTLICYEYIYA